MITIIRKIGIFIINLQYTIVMYLLLLMRKKRVNIPVSEGEELFLLMNGPSLSETLSEYKNSLSNYDCICVNMMACTSDFKVIKPKYYVIADIKFWQKMEGIKDNSFLLEEQDKWDKIPSALVENTSWDMYLFLPDMAKVNEELINYIKTNEQIHIVFLNSGICFKGFDTVLYYLWKKQYCLPPLQNVLVLSIYVGLLMKYNKIYLLGCDHTYFSSFHVDDNNKFFYEYKHSYDKENVYKVPYDSYGDEYCMTKILKEYYELWETYDKLYIFSKLLNSNIYNCTYNSMIDVFPRKKIAEVLEV